MFVLLVRDYERMIGVCTSFKPREVMGFYGAYFKAELEGGQKSPLVTFSTSAH